MKTIIEHEEPLEYFASFDTTSLPNNFVGNLSDFHPILMDSICSRINIKLGPKDKITTEHNERQRTNSATETIRNRVSR